MTSLIENGTQNCLSNIQPFQELCENMYLAILKIELLIGWIEFNAESELFQPYNGGCKDLCKEDNCYFLSVSFNYRQWSHSNQSLGQSKLKQFEISIFIFYSFDITHLHKSSYPGSGQITVKSLVIHFYNLCNNRKRNQRTSTIMHTFFHTKH